ncbi:flagellar hook-basal body complex protein FliE [Methylobacterium gregans]|uniref:Flagellar hook-basal body complex protein FliE n=1 Tax=Methylobacterium gregans TaxID=374424 RepID=A0AA37HRG4_9HYPH|nr:flagellar hook-basal body complex protein FliE [Methylobacterium gregans]MDQ0521027.1 flagellar hook-basal body complex protein FliE [Methylobacterium gregans]GJD80674.1 Flagellar hook-basal body complex protein FliE [Methylobacterium gregans]GLS54193.1 flagellar hook-basal body complex protein FliE [Methylobacterium gregans]
MIEALGSLSAFDKAVQAAALSRADTAPVQKSAFAGAAALAGGVPAASPGGSTDFADIMAQLATSVRNDVRAGEAASIAGIQGKATTQQVVEAVMSAEQSLQTAVAIRDKVVAAYLELSRMAI